MAEEGNGEAVSEHGQDGQAKSGLAAGGGAAAANLSSFILANMQGLVGTSQNKSSFLWDLTQENNSIWCAVTVTWLSPDKGDREHFSGYALLRCDQAGRLRGGACLFPR